MPKSNAIVYDFSGILQRDNSTSLLSLSFSCHLFIFLLMILHHLLHHCGIVMFMWGPRAAREAHTTDMISSLDKSRAVIGTRCHNVKWHLPANSEKAGDPLGGRVLAGPPVTALSLVPCQWFPFFGRGLSCGASCGNLKSRLQCFSTFFTPRTNLICSRPRAQFWYDFVYGISIWEDIIYSKLSHLSTMVREITVNLASKHSLLYILSCLINEIMAY